MTARRRPPRARRAVAVAVALVAGGALAGCVRMPDDGPVVETRATDADGDQRGVFINPPPPVPGGSRADIIDGFLNAMTATPISTRVAKQFLTEEERSSWDPERQTLTYGDVSEPRGGTRMTVTLSDAERLDSRGAWQGPIAPADRRLRFRLVVEGGEWRIAEAPDALVVPDAWFQQRFRQVSLYYFDPAARILVPEPVFVPRGEQLATTLVTGLLRGPGRELDGVARSFLPAGLTAGLSVPVSSEGLAEVPLEGNAGQQNLAAGDLMLAQLAWTLRQEPSIEAFRVLVNGDPVRLPGGRSEVPVDDYSAFDPAGSAVPSQLYGLRKGLLVAGPPGAMEPVDGPLGRRAFGLRSVAVDLRGTQAAAVSGSGRSLLLAGVADQGDGVTEVLSEARGLLRPSYDVSGRAWLAERRDGDARVHLVERGQVRPVLVPGVTGRDVSRLLVSRDGSRLVAVLPSGRGDALTVSRVVRDDDGRVLRVRPAVRLAWQGGRSGLRIRDIGWQSPTTIAVLHRLADQLYEVRTIAVDGAPIGAQSLSTALRGRFVGLAASPVADQSLYGVTRGGLYDLSGTRVGTVPVERGTVSIGYAG